MRLTHLSVKTLCVAFRQRVLDTLFDRGEPLIKLRESLFRYVDLIFKVFLFFVQVGYISGNPRYLFMRCRVSDFLIYVGCGPLYTTDRAVDHVETHERFDR